MKPQPAPDHPGVSDLVQRRLCEAIEAKEAFRGTVVENAWDRPHYRLDTTSGGYILHTLDFAAYAEAVTLLERLRRDGTTELRLALTEKQRQAEECRLTREQEYRRRIHAKIFGRQEAA
jgi:hypothetical protein